jgi:putative membrane protein
MKRITILTLLGTLLLVWLLARTGVAEVLRGVAAAGWGLLAIVLYRFVILAAHGMGWLVLFPASTLRMATMLRARWVGEAVNSLLPVAHVGGDFARGHMAALATKRGAEAGATVVVDVTIGLAAQLAFAMLGFLLLFPRLAGEQVRWLFVAILFSGLFVAALFVVQRSSIWHWCADRLEQSGDAWASLAGNLAAMNTTVGELYAQRRRIAACLVWRSAGWLVMTGETWLAMYFMGRTVSVADAVVLESLSQAVRAVVFVLPGGLGVHEGSFVVLGGWLGIGPEAALSLALIKRLRELVVGLPGLWVWSATEGRSLASLLADKGES